MLSPPILFRVLVQTFGTYKTPPAIPFNQKLCISPTASLRLHSAMGGGCAGGRACNGIKSIYRDGQSYHERQINVWSYDQRERYSSGKGVMAEIAYSDSAYAINDFRVILQGLPPQ